jgi:dihydroneopterin aldolase
LPYGSDHHHPRPAARRGKTHPEPARPPRSPPHVELVLNLQPAGIDDDLERSVDYGKVYEVVRRMVESTSYRLLEGLAEAISHELLVAFPVLEVGVRLRKPAVQLGGPLDYAGVEIWRRPSS